jgi:nicotinamidase-related amidase
VRHPLTLLTREVPPLSLRRGRSCLVLQDVHRPLADPDDGWLARKAREKVLSREFDEYFDMLRLVSPNFAILQQACRDLGLPVVFVCLGYVEAHGRSPFQSATGWAWAIDAPEWGIPDEWAPGDGDPVMLKPAWGALGSPEFSGFLSARKIESVIIAGTMYDYGIRQTCYELAERGIASLVVSDAVAALTHAGQAHTSGNLAHGLTKLRSTAELLDLLDVMRSDGHVLV